MTSRRNQVLDAAIRVLGTSGTRSLTHRATDTEAGLPHGSTSNLFRTRDALMQGVLERVLDRDIEAWNRLADTTDTFDIDSFAVVAGRMIGELAATDRVFALARFAVFVEAGLNDDLRQRIDENAARLSAWATPLIAALGSRAPRRHLKLVSSYLDGLLLNQLVLPSPTFDPADAIAVFLRAALQDPAPAIASAPALASAPEYAP
ncbi:TetR/AcrR family transcriptional regulator [Agromyces laixinhei]|uniref:TetR/AcrR family transcriptional regulator n=1 Tax=Agromyces laixinhei TaxID=2585717 RepID=UPI0018DB754B|nr:TetR/AcrR family transcriptional regulator [Agromyces laixinhei]